MSTDAAVDFEELQARLVPLWQSMQSITDDEQTIVVVPSISLNDPNTSGAEIQALEERFLFLLFLLRQPRARLIYVTSRPIAPAIVDYYLDLLPGVIPSQAKRRLHLVAAGESSPRPLTDKLLDRPRLLARIRELVPDPARAHIIPYNTTERERDLALALGIPMYGADPKHFPLGTKTGCRRLFAEEKVPHPLGFEDLRSRDDVAAAIQRMRAERPALAEVVVKLNEGVAGRGNGLLDVSGLPEPRKDSPAELDAIGARLDQLQLEADDVRLDDYFDRLAVDGGIVEERITGAELRSPSVQLRVTPLGAVEVLSTHDQLLGGHSGQTYLGCVFPADPAYAPAITAEAMKVGRRLAAVGVIGRFALDFLVARDEATGGWDPFAIEINLRKGGTTHPFLTLQFLTDGRYDPETATFTTPSGQTRCFVATDHAADDRFRGLVPDDLFDLAVLHRLHYDHARQRGVVFHMMSALSEEGQVGFTAVDETPEAARILYDRTLSLLAETAAEVAGV